MKLKNFEKLNRFPLVGPLFLAMALQYYLIQVKVAHATNHYSFIEDSISDLGRTNCTFVHGSYFCSPEHQLINTSLLILGIATMIGALLFFILFERSRATKFGFGLMAFSGAGVIIVGLFPENISFIGHFIGADTAFLASNISIFILALSIDMPKLMRGLAFFLGSISLTCLIWINIEPSDWHLQGIVERFIADPEVLWLMVFGIYSSYLQIKAHGYSAKDIIAQDR